MVDNIDWLIWVSKFKQSLPKQFGLKVFLEKLSNHFSDTGDTVGAELEGWFWGWSDFLSMLSEQFDSEYMSDIPFAKFLTEIEKDLGLEAAEPEVEGENPVSVAELLEAVARQINNVLCGTKAFWSYTFEKEAAKITGVRKPMCVPVLWSSFASFLMRLAQSQGEGVGRAGEDIPIVRPTYDPSDIPEDSPWSIPKRRKNA